MLCQHDDLGVGRQKKENVPETISRRGAGSWSVGFIWSVWFLWFVWFREGIN
jgi:hypothetical protein